MHVLRLSCFANRRVDIILSLTRTNRVGYLRDIRRLTVALSRARLGLYIVGRRDIFEGCYELQEAFRLLFQRPDKLMLVTGELFPTSRSMGKEVEATEMVSVEHLGQYVFEMSQAKIEALKRGEGVALLQNGEGANGIEDDEEELEEDEQRKEEEEGETFPANDIVSPEDGRYEIIGAENG